MPASRREGAATPQQAAGAASAAAPSTAEIRARCRPQLGWAVGVVFLLLPFLQAYVQPPEFFWKALLAASKCAQHSAADCIRQAHSSTRVLLRLVASNGNQITAGTDVDYVLPGDAGSFTVALQLRGLHVRRAGVQQLLFGQLGCCFGYSHSAC
jgi:hypothetical protein